jgi:microcin C transport system substrate-binding protein
MTAGFYPEPFQYFHSSMAKEPQTNNFWSFANPRVDELIDIYRFNLDREKRLAAMAELDEIIQEEAFYIPFWTAPFMRFCYWNWIEFPADFYPKRASNYMEYPTWWINEGARQSIEAARAAGRKLPADTVIEVDPHGVKPR